MCDTFLRIDAQFCITFVTTTFAFRKKWALIKWQIGDKSTEVANFCFKSLKRVSTRSLSYWNPLSPFVTTTNTCSGEFNNLVGWNELQPTMKFMLDIIWILLLPIFSIKWTTYQNKIANISLYAQVRNHGVMKGMVFFFVCQIPNGDFFIFVINKDIDLYPLCFSGHFIWVVIEAKSLERFVQLNHVD